MSFTRRAALKTSLAFAAGAAFGVRDGCAASAEPNVEKAHAEIWRRFIDAHDVMLDFTGLDGSVAIPTPEECRLGKPNALGWWSPIENGAMFNGLYMDAAANRWRVTQASADAGKARRLAHGLMFLASLSEVKGFVGRGVATDGKSHYPMGSNDQTLPWFYGLWLYLESNLADAAERSRIVAKLVETADAIASSDWRMPAEEPFRFRGSFSAFTWESAPRLLFVSKIMHRLTGDAKWDARYREGLHARGGKENLSRLELCERGMVFERSWRQSWTASCCVAALRALWEMEKDEAVRGAFARGLEASATLAMQSLPLAQQFDNDDERRFEPDWRKMNAQWKPQTTEQEAQRLAEAQLREFGKLSPRRGQETEFVREPLFAAWIVTLAPDKGALGKRAEEIEKTLAHYRYERLYYSQFFPAESAWWRLLLAS
jgi:hypothetical protein